MAQWQSICLRNRRLWVRVPSGVELFNTISLTFDLILHQSGVEVLFLTKEVGYSHKFLKYLLVNNATIEVPHIVGKYHGEDIRRHLVYSERCREQTPRPLRCPLLQLHRLTGEGAAVGLRTSTLSSGE